MLALALNHMGPVHRTGLRLNQVQLGHLGNFYNMLRKKNITGVLLETKQRNRYI